MTESAVVTAGQNDFVRVRAGWRLALMLCATLLSVEALAECAFPQPPSTIPNGATASQEEMVAASAAFRAYNDAVVAYQACLEKDTAERVRTASGNTAADEIRQLKNMQRRKHNEAVKELETKVGAFNEQIKAFKARG